MKKHIKEYGLLYLLIIMSLYLGLAFPDYSVTVTGGLAWFLTAIALMFSAMVVGLGIYGGTISCSAKGLISRFKKKN
ncbi:hypothetical protein EBB07_28555 [Paenibacillaceae bacterium]|nr:hypothetical protein EBB07_28555 [Paenibacillaceae bacterium]